MRMFFILLLALAGATRVDLPPPPAPCVECCSDVPEPARNAPRQLWPTPAPCVECCAGGAPKEAPTKAAAEATVTPPGQLWPTSAQPSPACCDPTVTSPAIPLMTGQLATLLGEMNSVFWIVIGIIFVLAVLAIALMMQWIELRALKRELQSLPADAEDQAI